MTIRGLLTNLDTRPDGLAWRQTTGEISLAQYRRAIARIRRQIEQAPVISAPRGERGRRDTWQTRG